MKVIKCTIAKHTCSSINCVTKLDLLNFLDLLWIRSMNVLIEPQDIAILTRSIIVDSAGRPVLTFFVQLNEDTFVSVATVSLALEVSSDIYRNAGFLLQDNSNNTGLSIAITKY